LEEQVSIVEELEGQTLQQVEHLVLVEVQEICQFLRHGDFQEVHHRLQIRLEGCSSLLDEYGVLIADHFFRRQQLLGHPVVCHKDLVQCCESTVPVLHLQINYLSIFLLFR
jgi:hypothetical protein